MKKLVLLFIASALVAPAVLSAASFEGKVSMKVTSGREKPMDINYSLKGGKLRIEMPGQKGGGGMIMDPTKREMIMLMDEQKMYMTMTLPEAAVETATKKSDDSTLEKTSETEKILGYTATKYIVTEKNGSTTDMWLAEGLGTFMSFNQNNPMAGRGRGGSNAQSWERALAGKELFPLRVVGKDKAAKETMRMEVSGIEKKSLPDALFAPPADYQKLDMGGMGGMLKGMIPGFGK